MNEAPVAPPPLGLPVANPLAWADFGSVQAAPPPPPVAASALVRGAPDAAVRARLNAIVIDAVLIGVTVTGVLSAFGGTVRSSTGLVVDLALQFAYFFVLEAVSGQTVGKRVFHVRVVSVDGAPITIRQIAIRNSLRFFDALPLLYASGLISLMRTGSAKRQRIGDVVAGTTVVVDPRGKPLRTPRWLLPIVTLLATALSIGLLIVIFNAPAPTTVAQITPPAGFTAGVNQAPALGSWTAAATITSSAGYSGDAPGTSFVRAWQVTRTCHRVGGCGLVLTRHVASGPPVRAHLVPGSDGWHATFVGAAAVCGYKPGGQPIFWPERSFFILRFTNGGRTAQANERDLSYTPACGYGTDTTAWTATHV